MPAAKSWSSTAPALTVLQTIVLRHSDKPDFENQGRGIPNYLGAVAISPDGRSAWVPSKQDNIKRGMRRDGSALNFQSTVRAISSRVDLDAGSEDYPRRIDHDNSGVASAIAFDRLGVYMFVALETSRQVAVIDAHAGFQVGRINVGRAPQGLAVSASGDRLYVNNFMERTVGVFDLTQLQTEGIAGLPLITNAATLASEKLSATVLQGKRLFYDAVDTRLARDAYLSCASCHNDGGQDGRVWDLTGFGEGLRNTANLNGRAGGQGFLHWTQQLRRSPGLRRADPEPRRRQRPDDQRPVQYRHAQRAARRPESRRERGPRRACRLRRSRSQHFPRARCGIPTAR